MKFCVKLTSGYPIVLPIHYNHILKGFIFSNFIKNNVPFTFSNIFGLKKIRNRKISFKKECHFYVATPEQLHFNGIEGRNLNLGRNRVRVDEVRIVEEEPRGPLAVIKTLSPVTVFVKEWRGKTRYFSPSSPEFYRFLEEDLKEKTKRLFNKSCEVKIRASEKSIFKKAVIQYRNRFIVEAWKGIFEIEGEREVIESALKLGLGYKNNQGFGMVALTG